MPHSPTFARIASCLSLIHIFFSQMSANEIATSDSQEEHYYQLALDYITNNYTYDLKVQDIADYVGIDRTYPVSYTHLKSIIPRHLHQIMHTLKKQFLPAGKYLGMADIFHQPVSYTHLA